MLKKVTLKNFQAHKNLELELDKFTTLTGGSNGGKSSVLRAIIALVRNDSAGNYLRHGQSTMSVTLEFADGNKVEWVKGTSDNKYILTSPDGTESTFDKVGANVPEEVKDVLKLGPILVGSGDKEYINFHQQLEAPFLISSTPGEVAKLFGELTSASQLYSAVSEGNRSVRSINAEKTTRMGDLRKIKIDLESFVDLEIQEADLEKVRIMVKDAEHLESKSYAIKSLVSSTEAKSSNIDTLKPKIDALKAIAQWPLDPLIDIGERTAALATDMDSYSSLSKRIERGHELSEYLREAVKVDVTSLREASVTFDALSAATSGLASAEEKILNLVGKIDEHKDLVRALADEYDALLESVEDCPYCKQGLSDHAKEALLKTEASGYAAH